MPSYTNSSFTPSLPDLFINCTTTGQLVGCSFNVNTDASSLPSQDNATRPTYFV